MVSLQIDSTRAKHTLQIGGLFLAEVGADIADPRRERDLQVLCHDLFALIDAALLLGLAYHFVYSLYRLLTFLEAPGDGLCQLLDFALLLLLDMLIVESREYVLLVQLVELPRLLRHLGEIVCDLVLDVKPSRWQKIHFDYRIAVVFEGARRHEPETLFGDAPAVTEAIRGRAAIPPSLGWVVRVGLAVGDVAASEATSAEAQGRCEADTGIQVRAVAPHSVGRQRRRCYIMAAWRCGGVRARRQAKVR